LRLLAFDTAGDGCSAGVFQDGRPLAVRSSDGGIGHAERLPRSIEAVLAEAGVDLDALDGLAVTVGPGSFSGIRTGLAAARGLALVTGLATVAVTTLEALAAPLFAGDAELPIAAVMDARRGQVFLQRFAQAGASLGPPEAFTPEAAAATLAGAWQLVGNGAALVVPHLAQQAVAVTRGRLDAAGVALAAERALAQGTTPVDGFGLHPCYARGADARPGAGRALVRLEG
jgi:tRNA threonylcarbamoyladenosine biosynthesis protein TsaB